MPFQLTLTFRFISKNFFQITIVMPIVSIFIVLFVVFKNCTYWNNHFNKKKTNHFSILITLYVLWMNPWTEHCVDGCNTSSSIQQMFLDRCSEFAKDLIQIHYTDQHIAHCLKSCSYSFFWSFLITFHKAKFAQYCFHKAVLCKFFLLSVLCLALTRISNTFNST